MYAVVRISVQFGILRLNGYDAMRTNAFNLCRVLISFV